MTTRNNVVKEYEVQQLVSMGFSREASIRSLAITGSGINYAMDWLIEHGNDADLHDPIDEVTVQGSEGHTLGTRDSHTDDIVINDDTKTIEDQPPEVAQSLVCQDCQKRCRSNVEAEAHAGRTGHTNFAESTDEVKVLSEEEKIIQLERIQQRIQEKKAERCDRERKEATTHEKTRRLNGKEAEASRHKYKQQEAIKAAKLAKREKEESKLAQQRIREQIAQDKADRLARSAPPPTSSSHAVVSSQNIGYPTASISYKKEEHTECRLQIRFPVGSPVTHVVPVGTPVAEVHDYLATSHNDRVNGRSFKLVANFPKRIFSPDDKSTTVDDAGLVPSSVLMLTFA